MKDEKGQALIELIIFLPLMITLYSVIGNFASAINGSINQQKIARSYFYYRIQNNSYVPGPNNIPGNVNWDQFGMFFIGWKDYFPEGGESGTPFMPCYKVSIPFKEKPGDKCEDKYSKESTLYVRVGTVYGVCGATYKQVDSRYFLVPDGDGLNYLQTVDQSSCIIK